MFERREPSKLSAAILSIQADPPVIVKTKTGQAGNQKTKYADLVEVYAAVRPRLNALGVIWTCDPDLDGERFVLRWELEHVESGEVRSGRYPLGVSDNPQQLGSRQSYATRYALLRVLGLAAEDDDDDGAPPRGERFRPPAPGSSATVRRERIAADRPAPAERARPASPPPVPPQTGPGADVDPNAATKPQMGKLHAGLNEVGITDRAERLSTISQVIGRQIGSATELTKAEASGLIDAIERAKSGEGPTKVPEADWVGMYQLGRTAKPAARARSSNAREALGVDQPPSDEPAPWDGEPS